MKKIPKILIIGSTVADVIMEVDGLPKTAQDFHIRSQRISLGGCAYNVSEVIRHLDVPYTLFSPVGTGVYGEFIRKRLTEQGVIPGILTEEENGCCYCMVEPGGERTFLSYHGTEYRFRKEWFDALDVSDYSASYICGLEIEEPTGVHIVEFLEKVYEYAESQVPELYFAPGPRILRIEENLLKRIFALRPILHLNEEEVCGYIGCRDVQDAVRFLQEQTGNSVVVTLGAKGSLVCEEGKVTCVPVAPVTVQDTIGAGDSHAGAVIALRAKGWSWQETLDGANRVASAVTTVSGAQLTENEWKLIQRRY